MIFYMIETSLNTQCNPEWFVLDLKKKDILLFEYSKIN